MTGHDLVALVVAVAVCLAAGAVGSFVTVRAIPTWYAALRRPAWAPPARVFPPVWTALYLMMAVAAWLVWRAGAGAPGRGALWLFALQLLLNTAWSPIFFGLRAPFWAFVDIVALWLAVAATAVAFRPISPLAAALLLPYLAWVTFAAALNVAVWRLNRSG